MGLPVFVVPVTPDAASKAAEKIASGPRSSIRRQRPARSQPLSVENIRRRIQGMAADASQDRYDVWENPTREQRPSPRRDEEPPAAPRPRFNEDRMRLRDTLSFERQSPPNMEIDGPLMPPAPEPREYPSADVRRREIQRLLEVRRDLRRIARRRPAPTPPYTDTDIALMARMRTESPRPSSVAPTRSPRLTPGQVEMATSALGARPATGQGLATREQRRLARSPPLLRLSFQDTEALAAQETPADGPSTAQDPPSAADTQTRAELSERVRILNRVSSHFERSRRFLRQQRLDGLGDRDRSLSPDGGATWDTLLTGITPDPQPPSVGSSFASTTAAAAATSASASANSGPTSTSTPQTSFGRSIEATVLHDCDISETDSDEELEDLTMLQNIVRRGPGRRAWSSWADVAAARGERVAQISSTEDTEHLGGMQRIISRLAERDDIPEEWWRMAGLRREPTS